MHHRYPYVPLEDNHKKKRWHEILIDWFSLSQKRKNANKEILLTIKLIINDQIIRVHSRQSSRKKRANFQSSLFSPRNFFAYLISSLLNLMQPHLG